MMFLRTGGRSLLKPAFLAKDLCAPHKGRQGLNGANLVFWNGEQVVGKDQKIRQLAWFDRTLYLFLVGLVRVVDRSDP